MLNQSKAALVQAQVSKRNILAIFKLSYILVIHLGEPTTDLAFGMLTCHRTLSGGASCTACFVCVENKERGTLPCCTRVSHRGVNSASHG